MNIQAFIKTLEAIVEHAGYDSSNSYCLVCNCVIKNDPPDYEYENHPNHVMIDIGEIPAVLKTLKFLVHWTGKYSSLEGKI